MIGNWSRMIRCGGLAACCLLVAGCSGFTEALDPRRLFQDDTPAAETAGGAEVRERAAAEAAEAGDAPFPALSSVPDRPAPPTPRQIRERVLEGLVSDRRNARYTDEVVRGRETPAATIPAAPIRSGSSGSSAAEQPSNVTVGIAAAEKAPPDSTTAPASDPLVEKVERPGLPAARVEPAVAAATQPQSAAPAPPAAPAQPEPSLASRTDQAEAPQVAAVQPTERAAADDIFATSAAAGALPLATIQFASGSARLNQNDRAILQQAAAVAMQESAVVKVVGHSSSSGTGDPVKRRLANFEASINRANAVAAALVEFGMAPQNVIVEARADQDPLYRETAAAGEAGNRRAELYLIR